MFWPNIEAFDIVNLQFMLSNYTSSVPYKDPIDTSLADEVILKSELRELSSYKTDEHIGIP